MVGVRPLQPLIQKQILTRLTAALAPGAPNNLVSIIP